MFYNIISSYYLCKQMKRESYKVYHEKPHEDVLSATQQMCRVCLKLGTIPIYGLSATQDISRAVSKFGDITITENDDYPKHLCHSCYSMLKGAILFQQRAKESDSILRNLDKPKFEPKLSSSSLYTNPKPTSSKHVPKIKTQSKKLKVQLDQSNDSLLFDEDQSGPPSPHLSDNFTYIYSENEYSDENNEPEIITFPQRISKVQCKICNKIMLRGSARNHLDLHSQTKKYICEICGKSYSQKSAYYTHAFTHSDNFAFKCKLCPYRSNTAANLKSHMRSHIRDYRHICSECPKRFLTKSNLNKHLLTHRGRSFKCNHCEKAYYNRRNLQIHIDVAHLGIKNHTCEMCGKTFGYRKRMLDHQLRVHKRQRMRYGRMPLYLRLHPEAPPQNVVEYNDVLNPSGMLNTDQK